MFNFKSIVRILAATLLLLSMLLVTFGNAPKAQAKSAPQEATPVDGTEPTQGLSDADWGQINALLPATVAPYSQQAYIKASNAEQNDSFGYDAVAVSGNTLVVGARLEASNATGINNNQADNSAVGAGAVYVFVRNGITWSQQAYIKASNTELGDYFGNSVAISGNTLVVGAHGEDSAATGINGNQADNSRNSSGAAYVFIRNGVTWTQQAYVKASNTGGFDSFGNSVAIAGDTIAISATSEASSAVGINGNQSNNSAPDSGAVYIFSRSGTTWAQQAYIKASNTGESDFFGASLAISGNTVVVGALGESSKVTGINGDQHDNSAVDAGAAYIFTRSGTTWSQQAYVKASNTDAGDLFGESVSISGDTVVVGSLESSNAVGVNGNQANNSALYAGAVYVFVRNGISWSQQAYLKASNTNAHDGFGYSVAISGDKLVVGANNEDSNATGVNNNQTNNLASDSGAAYVFKRNGSIWSQEAYLKSSNTNADDQFSYPVAISGNTIAIGAGYEDSSSTGINGNQSNNSALSAGAAYIFDLPTPTVLTSLRSNASPTTAASVNYIVSFSEPVTGVDISDFVLAKSSGVSGATVTGVSGGPANYVVSVNTGSGSGTIRLAVYDNDSIRNANNIPLGGAGAGNGNFTTGETYLHVQTQTFQSQTLQDGWVLESGENSNAGGTMNNNTAILYLGDNVVNKQFRSMLHFHTANLPDTAVINKVTLKIKQAGPPVGTNPFTALGALKIDSLNPFFGTGYSLELADFTYAAAIKDAGGFNATPVGNWYSAILNSAGNGAVNRTGHTQFRLRFATDDNNNATADFMTFFSGDATTANRPVLLVEYYLP